MSQRPIQPAPSTQGTEPKSAASQLFDIRILIGGLFTLYGVVLIVPALVAGAAPLVQDEGAYFATLIVSHWLTCMRSRWRMACGAHQPTSLSITSMTASSSLSLSCSRRCSRKASRMPSTCPSL